MARLLRVQYEGALYHLTVRGNAQQAIFLDDHDRERFLEGLSRQVETHGVRLYLFCLMTNHLHLMVETPRANLSAFMSGLLTGYTVYFNLRHQRSGHVTQGRYGAKLVEGERYLDKLSRYIHLNPVNWEGIWDMPLTERLCVLREYRWSSYRSYIGQDKRWPWVTYGPVLATMGGKKRSQEDTYRDYVERGLAETNEDLQAVLKKSAMGIGSEDFCGEIEERYAVLVEKARQKEDVAFRVRRGTKSAEEVLAVVGKEFGVKSQDLLRRRRNAVDRAVTAWMLIRYVGLTQREAGVNLVMGSGAAVSFQLKRLQKGMRDNVVLRRQVSAIEKQLNQGQ